ncbi:MAG: radical SAM protein [Chitinispirillaceae bacterium]
MQNRKPASSDIEMPESFGFQWHITDRCAGRCLHCYQDRFDGSKEQSCDDLKRISDHIMTSLPVPVSINLTGGEPLLYPGFFDLLGHISEYNTIEELNVITSATVLGEAVLEKLSIVTRLTYIKVSLESNDPAVNDSIRGSGHFEKVVHNIGRLVNAGHSVVLMVTLGSCNFDSVAGICGLAGTLGVSGVIFERYVPLGRGKGIVSNLLSPHEWAFVIQEICRIGEVDTGIEDLLAYKAFWVDMSDGEGGEAGSVRGALCNLGPSSMALMPDGTVFPCRRLPFSVGKMPEESIFQILERLQKYSPRVLKSQMKGSQCGSCGHDECVGCRALTISLGGGLLDDDPQCPIRCF